MRIRIREKILGTLLIVALFAFLATNLLWTLSVRSSLKKEIFENQEKAGKDISQSIQEFLQINKTTLIFQSQTATILRLVELEKGKEEALFQLSLLLRNDEDLRQITLFNDQGDELIRMTTTTIYAKEELANRMHEPKFFFPSYRFGQEYLSSLYFSQDDEPMITISVPIVIPIAERKIEDITTIEPGLDFQGREPGAILGVLSADIYMGDVMRLFKNTALGEGGYAYIIDENHRIIAHPDSKIASSRLDANQVDIAKRHFEADKKSREMSEPHAPITFVTGIGKSELGDEVLATFVHINNLFGVVIQQPMREAFIPIYNAQQFAAILSLVGILMAGFISFAISNRLTKPIKQLNYGVERIRTGDLSYQIKTTTSDEIGELTDSFNVMTADLAKSRAALEEAMTVLEIKVQARTRELKELNEKLEERVLARTKEVHEEMAELERFYKMAVGRELKMVELKKEIEKSKKK